MENKDLIQKADVALANLTADGGMLNPEQADKFIRKVIEQPTLIGKVRTVPMGAPTMKVNKIGFGSRILRAASNTRTGDNIPDGRSLAMADRSKPDFGQIELNTSEVIAEVRLPYEVLEDNIERGDLTNTLLTLIAERASLDLEELLLLGDTGSGDPYLAMQDGILKRVTSNTVDGTDLGITADLFNNTIKALPKKYRRNKNLMKFVVDLDVEQDYRNTIAARGTGLGDAVITNGGDLPVFGVPMLGNSLIPYGNVIFTNPKNILFGIQRKISIEVDKDISAREWKIVLTARVAVQIEEEEAAVLVSNVGVTTP